MILTFIGSGSAFTVDNNFHSNLLLTNRAGEHLLLDCGSDARWALDKLGYSYRDIDNVYISHLHADHAGGLEWLGFTRTFDPNCQAAQLLIADTLQDQAWNNLLAAGMRSIDNVDCSLQTYFKPAIINTLLNKAFRWSEVDFNLVAVKHIYDNTKPVPCYGLLFQVNNKTIWWTADCRFEPEALQHYYQVADLIFHDCETTAQPSGVHPHFSQLQTLPDEVRAKTWLYHYNPGELPDAKAAGFHGFVMPGQQFDLQDVTTYTSR